MSLWPSSTNPGSTPPKTFDTDKHLPDNIPATGTQTPVTNFSPNRTKKTRVVIKDAKILFIRDDDSISASFSIIPELDEDEPVIIIAKDGEDVYLDTLSIDRPKM